MCQATVYLDDQEIMRDVIWLEPTSDGILMRTFFGEPQEVKGTLQGIDLLKHRVLVSSVRQEGSGI
ncbi:MAG: CooT family nickel-binding protein [Anaerolineae bacterium]|nr:CooT family nickel-binding protein [Anaerolineae bacterium]